MNILAGCETFRWDNGLRAVHLYRNSGSVALQILLGAGSIDEGELAGSGIAHFLEHMLFQGCEGFPGRRGPEIIEQHGGELNAYTGLDKMTLIAKVSPRRLAETLAILSSMVRTPTIPERRFAAEKQVIMRECDRGRDNASRRLSETIFALNFPGHPLGLPIIGFPANLTAVRRADLVDFHHRLYVPANCVVVAVGEVERATFTDLVEKYFGTWTYRPVAPTPPPELLPVFGKERTTVFDDPHEFMAMGAPVPPITDPRSPQLDLLWGLLAGAPNAALNVPLEMERALALGVRGSFAHFRFGGYGGVVAMTTPDKFSALRRELPAELRRIAATGFSARQLRAELTQRQGDWLSNFNNVEYLANQLGNGLLLTDRADFAAVYQERLEHTSVDEVNALLPRVLPESLNVCIQRNRKVAVAAPAAATRREKIEESRFSGMRVARWETELPMAYGSIVVPGGSIFEPANQRGVASLLANLWLCGTRRYSEKGLLDRLDALGAVVNFRPGANTLSIEFNAPRKNLTKLAELIGEILAAGTFTPEQFEREKEHLKAQLRSQCQSPYPLAALRAKELLLGKDHPYCGVTEIEQIERLTPDMVENFRRRIWRPAQIGVAFTGVAETAVAPTLERLLGGVKMIKTPLPIPVETAFATGRIRQSFALPREQLAVVRILPGVRLADQLQEWHLGVLNAAENNLFSPLFQSVREDNSLAYAVGMQLFGGRLQGGILLYALTASGNGDRLEKLFASECAQLAKNGLSRAKFAEAVEQFAFNSATFGEDPAGLVGNLALNLHYRHVPRLPSEQAAEIAKLDYGENRRIIRDIFTDIPEIIVRTGAIQ